MLSAPVQLCESSMFYHSFATEVPLRRIRQPPALALISFTAPPVLARLHRTDLGERLVKR